MKFSDTTQNFNTNYLNSPKNYRWKIEFLIDGNRTPVNLIDRNLILIDKNEWELTS